MSTDDAHHDPEEPDLPGGNDQRQQRRTGRQQAHGAVRTADEAFHADAAIDLHERRLSVRWSARLHDQPVAVAQPVFVHRRPANANREDAPSGPDSPRLRGRHREAAARFPSWSAASTHRHCLTARHRRAYLGEDMAKIKPYSRSSQAAIRISSERFAALNFVMTRPR